MKNILIIPIIIFSTINCNITPKNIKISFTGDIIMHLPVKKAAKIHNIKSPDKKASLNNNGFDFLFKKTDTYLKTSDIVLGNMEFPVSPPFTSVPWIFNCPPEILAALKKSGFTMMNIANNHILDQGQKGVLNTINYLNHYRLDYIGTLEKSHAAKIGIVKKINGIKIGFIAYTGSLNYKIPEKNAKFNINGFYNRAKVINDIKDLKVRCNYIVLSVHTGVEYSTHPIKKDIQLMKEYINQGVDLIIGHHPHILQKAEKIISKDGRECFIFYSLGNFISNQSGIIKLKNGGSISTRDSVIVTLNLSKNGKKIISRFELLPIMTVNRYNYKNRKREIQTVPINNIIKEYRTTLKKKGEKERTKIKKKIILLLDKKKIIKEVLFNNKIINEIKFL